MKVLIVCSRRYYAPYTDYVAPFIYEQVQALRERGVECEYYLISGGWQGYIKALRGIHRAVKHCHPDLIHAHSGLCALVAVLTQLKVLLMPCGRTARVPVLSTFHGSDVNSRSVRWLSKVAMRHSNCNIFVSNQLQHIAGNPANAVVVPCSVNIDAFRPMSKAECRRQLGWEVEKIYVLFSKEFSDRVKNYPLAKQAMERIAPFFRTHPAQQENEEVILIELYGYTRQQMPLLYNACDAALLTSFTEGSPQFIKEAVACGCPVVSTDVGDVREVVEGVPNAYITSYDPDDVAMRLCQAIADGHLQTSHLHPRYTTPHITDTIYSIYQSLCNS